MRPSPIKKPLVSVIVPVEPGGDAKSCLQALKALDWPSSRLEGLLVRGRQPSRQRNLAAAQARGDWLLFLDSDSEADPRLAQDLTEAAAQIRADVVGGPNLPPRGEAWPGVAFSAVLGSYFGSMSARSRYARVGPLRLSSEKELILCNLLIRRSAFVALKGFREDLYPNEENEFLNRLQASGGRLAYEPAATVRRPRRSSVAAFTRQAFGYGRGRMRQMRVNFFAGDLIHLMPVVALAYAAAWPWMLSRGSWASAPILAYLGMDVLACLGLWLSRQSLATAALAFFLFPLRHGAYGLGLLAGIFKNASASPASGAIQIEKIRL